MAALRNYNIGKNVNFTFSWKIFTFFFFVLLYRTCNDVSPFCKSLEIICKNSRSCNTKFNRLLARHDHLRDLEHTRLREKLSDRRRYTEKSNVSNNIKTYSHAKRNVSNNIDVYMKNYKHRYGKKKGLSKLDCYYENKVFRKINHICDIAEKVQYNEKRAKKIFLKKYGIGLIFFCLIPALGFIFPILFGEKGLGRGLISYCVSDKHQDEGSHDGCSNDNYIWNEYKTTLENIGYFSYIFFSTFGVIVSLVFIYIIIKVIKYERLKAGKGKLCVQEYCRFAKDVFV